jgi:hypothetical protein
MNTYTIKTQSSLRDSFWNIHTQFQNEYRSRKRQNDYRADIRMAFVDFVDSLARSGQISEALAQRATL